MSGSSDSTPGPVTVPFRGGQIVVTVNTSLHEMANAIDAVELAYEARLPEWPAICRSLLALLPAWVGATPNSTSRMDGIIHRVHKARFTERLTDLLEPPPPSA